MQNTTIISILIYVGIIIYLNRVNKKQTETFNKLKREHEHILNTNKNIAHLKEQRVKLQEILDLLIKENEDKITNTQKSRFNLNEN